MSTSEAAYRSETVKVVYEVPAEGFDNYSTEVLADLRESAERWAIQTFEGQRGTKAYGAQWRTEQYVMQDADPETLAPYETPRYYYVATVAVW